MAAPPIIWGCRSLWQSLFSQSTARSALPSIRTALPCRGFRTSTKLWQETMETPRNGADTHSRSIAILRVSKQASKSDITGLLSTKGYDVKRVSMLVDRFTFTNSTQCFVELGNEKQALNAVKTLNKLEWRKKELIVRPLREDFEWMRKQTHGRYFNDGDANASRNAALPLIEGRRAMLSVQTPGWGAEELSLRARHAKSLKIISQNFNKYGVELLGPLHPFYGHKKEHPRMLCFLDFETKAGAEQAIEELHDTTIEDRRVWLQISIPASWRAHQIGKVDKTVLAELQEKGLAPEETREDKFATPITKQTKKKKD